MYQIGDDVLYGIHGVCRVVDQEERCVDKKRVTYLVLEPKEQTGARFYVPCHNPAAMAKLRSVMTKEELDSLLRAESVRENAWIEDENQRKQHYRELISSGDREALLRMVGTLHVHKEAQAAAGRKFHLCDENFLRDAEKLLSAEIALVLGIEPSQVGKYVVGELNKK